MLVADLIEEAARIGHRIVGRAMRDGDACTWEIVVPDAARGRGASRVGQATDVLYQGASGIALFLGELWDATGDPAALACARQALRHCERIGSRQPVRLGLHSGNVGVALAAARLAALTRDDEWRQIAARRLEGLAGVVDTDRTHDVIAGAAGAILGLLRIARLGELPGLRELALRLGEHLEQAARRSPNGWSWPSGAGTVTQDLTGYAHGTSGMAHAFLELYAATGDSRWQFAASRAMAYERYHELPQAGDWPDFRCGEMIDTLAANAFSALRARLLAGEAMPPLPPPGTARTWCHGAPGIALARARALSLGVDSTAVRAELERALRTTRQSLATKIGGSHCLCHGLFGNAESLLVARERLGIDDHGLVESTVERALASFGSATQPWVTGVVGGGYDPSLLVGEAGIGLFLLRMARPAVASVLCLSDWPRPPRDVAAVDNEHRLAELEHLLPLAVRAARRVPGVNGVRERITTLASSTADLADVVADVRQAIVADPSAAGDMLRDALAVDATMLDDQLAFTDFVHQFCQELIRPAPEDIDWRTAQVGLAPHVRVIRTQWAWSAWRDEDDATPPADEEVVLVYRSAQTVRRMTVTALHGVILDAIAAPTTLHDIVATVMASLDPEPSQASALPACIRGIVQEAVMAGFAEVVSVNAK